MDPLEVTAREYYEHNIKQRLDMTLDDFIKMMELLEQARKILSSDGLYVQRLVGLKNGTTKEDVIDCPYVAKCINEVLRHEDESGAMTRLMVALKDAVRLHDG